MGINEFSDMSFEEFASKYLSKYPIPNISNNVPSSFNDSDDDLPNLNWLDKGMVSKVKNQ